MRSSIRVLSGFKAKAGSKFTASIGNVDYGTTLQSNGTFAKKDNGVLLHPANYTKPSPFLKRVYDYSVNNTPESKSIPFAFSVWPNPAKDIINLDVFGIEQGVVNVQLINTLGQVVYAVAINTNGITTINISGLTNGVYIIKASYRSIIQNAKIVKL